MGLADKLNGKGPLITGVLVAIVAFGLGVGSDWVMSIQTDIAEQRNAIVRQSETIKSVRSDLSQLKVDIRQMRSDIKGVREDLAACRNK